MNKDVLSAKQEIVKEIVTKAQASSGIVIAEYRGLTVAQTQELRRALAAEKATMNVYKNSLVERASDELGYSDLKQLLEGPNAVFFSEEIGGGAKVLAKYAKRYGDSLKIKGGVFEGKYADKAGVFLPCYYRAYKHQSVNLPVQLRLLRMQNNANLGGNEKWLN